ncbi:M48 family metallopeptidase [Arthrobacter sp. MPF02]|uniref:M48 family metallopeptidase n=1 Tax=Arthrobacter sp. MPF02 TaxID=3388492 RepID=UPI0039855EDD
MSTANSHMLVSGIEVDVVYKDIKNLHISVYPPSGRVRVAAPNRFGDDAVRLAVVQRLPWIRHQREQLQGAERQTQRKMLSGESHYVWGRRLILNVSVQGKPDVSVRGKTLWLLSPEGSSAEVRRRTLDRWYRCQLKAKLPRLVAKWEKRLDVKSAAWSVRRMKTKWGTCNPDTARVCFNLELSKKDPRYLEYIVVHELAHLRERTHNERFIALLDEHLPHWRLLRDELNQAPLSAEEWDQL